MSKSVDLVKRTPDAMEPAVLDAEVVPTPTTPRRPVGQKVIHAVGTIREKKPVRQAAQRVVKSPVVKKTGRAVKASTRVTVRASYTVALGHVAWAKRAGDGATHGVHRQQVRRAVLTGDQETLAKVLDQLDHTRDARSRRLRELPRVILGILVAAITGIALIAFLLLVGGIAVWAYPDGIGWHDWWHGVSIVLDWIGWGIQWAAISAPCIGMAAWLKAAWNEGNRYAAPPRWMVTDAEKAEMDSLIDERMISLALANIGNAALNAFFKEGGHLQFTVIPRVDGDGTYAQVKLCMGVTAEELAKPAPRAKLAGNLHRSVLETWPTVGDEAGLLDLWVADKGKLNAGAGPWPLQADGTVDAFDGVPFGRSQRGDTLLARVFETNWLLGGRPGQGKSSALRTVLLGCALDPTVELQVFVMGESPDFAPFGPRLSRYAMGMDDSVAEAAIQALRDALVEMERRGKVLGAQPGTPPKTNRQLANNPKLGLHLLIIAIDECFPAGTLVGDQAIEQLRPGDLVPSWDEETGMPCDREVRRVFKKRPHHLVRIVWDDGQELVCTPGHPLMTKAGWCPAGAMSPDTEVLSYAESWRARGPGGDRGLRDLLEPVPSGDQAAGVLAKDRSSVLLFPLRVDGAVSHGIPHQDGRRGARGDVGADAGDQSDAQGRGQGERVGDTACDGTPPPRQGWEWDWADRAATPSRGGARLADGGHCADGFQGERGADALEAGPGSCRGEGRGGDRRDISLLAGSPRVGSTEGSVARWRRVDRVEVLEPGSDGRYGGLCPDGHVYNLEVAGTHTYRIADGVVAHNCHELFQHPDLGKEAAALTIRLIKRGRKYGISLILATQSPTKDSIPRDVTRNVTCGVAFSVADHVANDGLLGTGKYKAGIRATELRPNVDRGTAVTVGITDNAFELIRTFFIPFGDGVDEVTPVVERAMAGITQLRRTGEDLAELEGPRVDLLQEIWEVLDGPREELRVVLPRLKDRKPEVFRAWNQTRLAEYLQEEENVSVGFLKGYRVVLAADVEERLNTRFVDLGVDS